MIKIRFFSNRESSDSLLNRFKDNYNVYDDDLEFTINDDYDYAVVFNRTKDIIKANAKTITIIQEPSWSPAHENPYFLLYSDYLIIHDRQLFEKAHHISLGGKIIESPSYMFFHDRVNQTIFKEVKNIPKQEKLSIIISGLNYNIGNYNKRIIFLQKVIDSDLEIDIYGRWLNIGDRRFKGELDYKYAGLIPYEYSIAIENSNEKNYITEKFFDCVICNVTPIYSGAPNIQEVYDSRFFKLLDLDSPTVIEDIKNIISKPAVGSGINKDLYFNKFNLYTKLKEIIFNDG